MHTKSPEIRDERGDGETRVRHLEEGDVVENVESASGLIAIRTREAPSQLAGQWVCEMLVLNSRHASGPRIAQWSEDAKVRRIQEWAIVLKE